MILITLKMSLKNLTANKGRSVVCATTVAVSVAGMIFLHGLQSGFSGQMVDASIRFGASHIRLVPSGYREGATYRERIENPQEAMNIIQNDPEVAAVARKVISPAMLRYERRSRGVLMIGIDPGEQEQLGYLSQSIIVGKFMHGAVAEYQPALVGEKLSSTLDLQVGKVIQLIIKKENGKLNAQSFRIAGILRTGNTMTDKFEVYVPLQSAQTLLSWDGAVTQIDVLLDNPKHVESVEHSLAGRMQNMPVELLTWAEIVPALREIIQKDRLLVRLILIVLAITVGTALGNTLLNSVYDRQGEIGTVMGLGAKPSQMGLMLGAESVILVLIGLVVGSVMGTGIVLFMGARGIDLSQFGESILRYIGEVTLYPRLNGSVLLWPVVLMLIVSVASCLHPAAVAARMTPLNAMQRRHR